MLKKSKIVLVIIIVFLAGISVNIAVGRILKYHTSPDKWDEPRVFHGPFEREYLERIKTGRDIIPVKATKSVFSPNKAYFYFINGCDPNDTFLFNTTVSIYNERDYLVQICLIDHKAGSVKVNWINEKLLYVEVWWGGVLGTAMIFDVESEKIIHQEMIYWGNIEYLQWKQAKNKHKIDINSISSSN